MANCTESKLSFAKLNMNIHLLAYYIGIAIVFLSHIYIAVTKGMSSHTLLNIFGGALIAYYFMNKEGFIKF